MTAILFQLENIHFSRAHGAAERRAILKGVDLTLVPGERVGLEGENGAGKTSLLEVMMGFLSPDEGRITAFGQSFESGDDFYLLRTKAGYLFQSADDQLFCPTVAEDVAFGPLNLGKTHKEARLITASMLSAVGLEGFESRVTYHLSGGEKKLAALAAVLAMEPELLLLDEPTAGLDTSAIDRLEALLTRLPQAMLIISHDAEFLERVTSRRVKLAAGKLVSPQ
ncbi:MAG: energy-coupling factor ABC transporter ATP-binding protein [Rhodomicrobium sp.]|nr:MAG: energy-coupling factor ABC transporter ATP-binding protein [Rhodomicrobium sp.]